MTAIGIDLGTTYSCVAAIRNDKIEIIANQQGNRVTPSYVAFTCNERIVGDAAKHQESMNAENTLYQIKRMIGRKYNDVALQKDLKLWKFKVANDENNPKLTVNYKGKQKTLCPEEVSAMVLSYMKETAEAFLGKKISDAVITVPAHFNNAQRKATRDAGAIAGLNILAMINEPTAAAIAYGLERDTIMKRTVLIFDLGGGTFDITIFRIENNVIDVLATGGDSHLGGEDFTDAMLMHFSSEFNLQHNVDMMQNPKSISRLRKECELAKRALSTSTTTTLQVECLYNGIDFSSSYSRTKFEILNENHFTKTLETVKGVTKDAGVSKEQIDDIVLVGGSTRIPKVCEMLEEYFHKQVLKTINVDEAVAYGAAVQAAILTNDASALIKKIKLHDVASLSLGIESGTSNDMAVVVPRNTRIPTKKWKTFVTSTENQTRIRVLVYEGERPCTDDNHHLGTFDVDNLPPLPKGEVQFDVCFEIDNAGILTVTARDKVAGNTNNIVINNDKGIKNREEIERMIADANKFKDEDQKFLERSAFVNKFEDYIYKTKKSLHEIKGSDLEEEKNEVLNKCTEMEQYLKDKQKTMSFYTLEFKKRELERVCHPLLGKLYRMQKHN